MNSSQTSNFTEVVLDVYPGQKFPYTDKAECFRILREEELRLIDGQCQCVDRVNKINQKVGVSDTH